MYTNADFLSDKIGDLNCFIKSLLFKPNVIAITEVNSKNSNTNLNISKLNLIGYNIFHSIESQGHREVIIYVSSDLDCQQVYFSDPYKDSVVVKIKLSNGQLLYIAHIICTEVLHLGKM